jgi:hypothetical protein
LKLFLLSQNAVRGYDTYDSMVVVAENAEVAKRISPTDSHKWSDENNCWTFLLANDPSGIKRHRSDWANRLEDIKVEELGDANENQKAGIICASFNAG